MAIGRERFELHSYLEGPMRTRIRYAIAAAAVAASVAVPAAATGNGAGGVSGPAFYVDGEVYRTVGTPTDLSHTGAPAHSFDTLYDVSAYQSLNVSEAAPGVPGYNGGRWRVQVVTFSDHASALAAFDANGSGNFDSDEEVEAAIAAGMATTSAGPSFVCPVIKLPGSG
jgi:hypothetical protein